MHAFSLQLPAFIVMKVSLNIVKYTIKSVTAFNILWRKPLCRRESMYIRDWVTLGFFYNHGEVFTWIELITIIWFIIEVHNSKTFFNHGEAFRWNGPKILHSGAFLRSIIQKCSSTMVKLSDEMVQRSFILMRSWGLWPKNFLQPWWRF